MLSPLSILRQKKLALLADKTQNFVVAKKAYAAAIKLGKNSIHGSSADYSGLANIHLKSNAANEAMKILYELNQQPQNDAETKLRAALLETGIHQAKGNKALAQQAYEKTFKLNQQFSKHVSRELRLEIARTFYLNGNGEICDEILNDLIRTHIDDKPFIKDIVTMSDIVIGENHAQTLIQHIKKELVDINNKGVSLFQEGNIKGALAVFEKAIAKMPHNQTIILNMIKIIIHDLKTSKSGPEKIISAQSYINKAIQIGMPHNQIGSLQTELDAIQYQNNQ
jgi:tetratricopeptide (TPR) repeat protein